MEHIADVQDDLLVTYSRRLDELAWYNRGDIFDLMRLARKLGRNFTIDLADRRKQLLDSAR